MSASATANAAPRADATPSQERRWHPATRAMTMVALGALAWVPVIAAGRLIVS